MLFPLRRTTSQVPKPQETAASSYDHHIDLLFGAVETMIHGRPLEDLTALPSSWQERIINLAKLLQEKRATRLDQSVALSINLNEAVSVGAQMSRSATDIKDRSSVMAAAIEELTVSADEISANTHNVANEALAMQELAIEGRHITNDITTAMDSITGEVRKTSVKVERLVEASEEIATVLEFITEIANKTNLLALNATIEAARAGEAGKGFAVVASEVKQLANQTSDSAKTIKERIEQLDQETKDIIHFMQEVNQAVTHGQKAANTANGHMEKLSDSIASITTQMQNVAAILGQQKEAAEEISSGVASIATMAETNLQQTEITLDAMDQAEALLVAQLQDFVGQNIPHLTIKLAKSDHIIWKRRLANMMAGRESLNPDELSSHQNCRLGKWYYGANSSSYQRNPSFAALEKYHQQVHHHGIAAARFYREGNYEAAFAAVQKVEEASKYVLKYLDDLAAS